MIRQLAIVFVFTIFIMPVNGQKHLRRHKNISACEQYPVLLDSLHSLKLDKNTGEWVPDVIRHYFSSNGKYDRLIFLYGDNRKQYRSWEYYYDARGNMDLAISSFWGNESWIVNLKKESQFDEYNHKLNELRSSFKNDQWSFKAFYEFEYEGDKIVKSHYQVKDAAGDLYDLTYSFNTFAGDKLVESRSINAIDGTVREVNRYFYNESDKLSEYIILLPGHDESGDELLIPYRRRVYVYDEYTLLREVFFDDRNGDKWETTSKYVYFYKLDTAKKVAICHNDKNICVSKNAVKAHLAHGDKLGECENTCQDWKDKGRQKDHNKKVPFIVYPNPAQYGVNIKFDKEICDKELKVELADQFGKVLRSYKVKTESFRIERGDLMKGNYFLRVTGKERYSAIIFFN